MEEILLSSECDDEEHILDTAVTWKRLEELMQVAFRTKASFGGSKRLERIGVGQGYTSRIIRIYLDWRNCHDNDNKSLPDSVIIKTTNTESDGISKTYKKLAIMVHNTETEFYRMAHERNLQLLIPRCYILQECIGRQQPGIIAMEDMGEEVRPMEPEKDLTIEELYQVFDAIASLHAFSLKTNHWKRLKWPTMSDICKDNDVLKDMLKYVKTPKVMADMELGRLMVELDELADEIFDCGIVPVLVHGDLWTSNLLWTTENDKNKLAAIIDWQVCHPGCVSEDLTRIICCSLGAEDRRSSWRCHVDHYYQLLTKKLGHIPPFAAYQLKKAYLRLLPFEAAMALPMFGQLFEKNPEASQRQKFLSLLEDILLLQKHPESVAVE